MLQIMPNRKLSVFILTIFLIFSEVVVLGSNYSFSHLNGEDGLSQNNVKSIIQDSYGFMWFGTRNKLNRYDGTFVKTFDCFDPQQKKRNNNISSLFEDEKKQLWIGTDKGVFIFNPISESFTFLNDSTNEGIRMEDWVADIQTDNNNNIWIVIPNQGLFRYNTKESKLHYYSIGSTRLPDHGNPQCLCIEKSGRVWTGTNGGGVHLYNKENDTFKQYLGTNNGHSLEGDNIYTMCDIGEELIIGIHEGKLQKFNKRRNIITDVNAAEVHYKIIRHVAYINEKIWVGTQNGLYIIDEKNEEVTHLHEDPLFSNSISDNIIEKIYQDKEKGIWIATNFGGVDYLPNRGLLFEHHTPQSFSSPLKSIRVREMKEDGSGKLWIATEEAGLYLFDPSTKKTKVIGKDTKDPLSYHKIVGLLSVKQRLWVGLFKNGLDILEQSDFSVSHYSGQQLGLNESSIYALCEDRNGSIWIGNAWGVFVSTDNSMKFTRQDQFGLNFIYDIIEDAEGNIWVATMGNGVYKYNLETNRTQHYLNDIEDPTSLSSNSVSNITETTNGELWFATDRGGICVYSKSTNSFTSYSVKEGLPDDTSYKILEDKNQNLWFGTNKGLVCFNPTSKALKVYTKYDGLPGNQFNYKSALAASTGKMYFGGLNGFIEFDPLQINENEYLPPVYITQLSIYDNIVDINSEKSPLSKSIIHTDKLVLNYNQSIIGFNFVSLSYTAPLANKYAYMMEGIDDDWVYTKNGHSASYAKLPPGKYTFHVKGSNNDGLWNNKGTSLQIVIRPPWWRSQFALIVYFILILSCLFTWSNWYKRKTKKRNDEKQQLYEREKERELYSSKLDFYTNIAHEIRTPITLINGPLESMLEMEIPDKDIKKNLTIMQRNTSQLLNLINQLLDFRKVDSSKFILSFSEVNISQHLSSIYSNFELLAVNQSKTMQLVLPKEDVLAVVDKNALTKIINNLLSNSIRYSNKYIRIELTTDVQSFFITVSNDGDLVPLELREKIFEPFYQVKKEVNETSTSGLGLSLAHSLSVLHNGSLSYNTSGDYNTFILSLPLLQEKAEKEAPENNYIIKEYDSKSEKQNCEIILLVEDNIEMLNFIADRLLDHYVVERATNGAEALKILEEKNVDLILTDVMMPVVDGFELCKIIKTNLEFSHIPVVLLTAKSDIKSKIHGLEMGADAYIEKPFSFGYLLTQLTTLLNNRKREKEAFLRKPFLPIQQMGMNKADEEFMIKMVSIIEENITDSNLNVERLAELVYMSRSTLHRKIKAVSDIPPTDFIRLIRLRKATELIAEGTYRIGEICYLVGINSPSYFIKLFQKQFGITPKEFEKQQKQIQHPN